MAFYVISNLFSTLCYKAVFVSYEKKKYIFCYQPLVSWIPDPAPAPDTIYVQMPVQGQGALLSPQTAINTTVLAVCHTDQVSSTGDTAYSAR